MGCAAAPVAVTAVAAAAAAAWPHPLIPDPHTPPPQVIFSFIMFTLFWKLGDNLAPDNVVNLAGGPGRAGLCGQAGGQVGALGGQRGQVQPVWHSFSPPFPCRTGRHRSGGSNTT